MTELLKLKWESASRGPLRDVKLSTVLQERSEELAVSVDPVAIVTLVVVDGAMVETVRKHFADDAARTSLKYGVIGRRAADRLIAIARGEDPPTGILPRVELGQEMIGEHAATLDDLRDKTAAAKATEDEKKDETPLFPRERVEKGAVRID